MFLSISYKNIKKVFDSIRNIDQNKKIRYHLTSPPLKQQKLDVKNVF